MGRDFGAARGEQHLVHEIDLQRFLETPDAHFLGIHFVDKVLFASGSAEEIGRAHV